MSADPPGVPHLPRPAVIEAYGNGGFRFDTMSHRGSLLCLPDCVWALPVTRADDIERHALSRVFACSPLIDTMLICNHTEVWLVPTELRRALRRVSIGVDTMLTGPAIRTYNIMLGERRRVAAALIAVP